MTLLLLAAVLGRRLSLGLLAAVADQPVDEVEDALAPARAAGLVHEPEADVVAFAHALTRDAVADTTSASRLARLHARVAHALADESVTGGLIDPQERVSELARHWLAAGPTHVSRAWRAAEEAAAQARRAFSYVEAERLMGAAVEGHRRDPLGTPEERYALLLTRAADARQNADWDQVLPHVTEAMALARGAGDVRRLAEAAAATTHNHVWMPQGWNEVHDDAVEDLRWGLAQLPTSDSVDRCRLMLALAVQLYYDPRRRPSSARSPTRAWRWPAGSVATTCSGGRRTRRGWRCGRRRTPGSVARWPPRGSRPPPRRATRTPRPWRW